MRRPKPTASDGNSESYLESLSDLLIGLLFIFIIILMSFALNLKVAESRSDTLQKHNTDAQNQRTNLLNGLQASMKRSGVLVKLDTNNGVLRLPESILFAEGSADVSESGQHAVRRLGRELAAMLPCYADGAERLARCPSGSHPVIDALFIEGHTDDIPISTDQFKNNWDLSAARSKNTYDALVKDAPGLLSMKNLNGQSLLSISAYGDTRPVLTGKSKQERRRLSRRIDLRFIIAAPSASAIKLQ